MKPLDPHPPKEELGKPPAWLISMGDVTALMLTFFVMLFSMSYVKSEKWDDVTSLLNRRLQPTEVTKPAPISEQNIPSIEILSGLSTDYLHRILSQNLTGDTALRKAVLTPLESTVVISLPENTVFDPGSDSLNEDARRAVSDLAAVLSLVGNKVEIVGHADPTAEDAGRFADRWALSLARALAVAEELKQAGYGGRIVAAGKGSSRFRHLDAQLPEERRYALSRRVDIVLHSEAGGQ